MTKETNLNEWKILSIISKFNEQIFYYSKTFGLFPFSIFDSTKAINVCQYACQAIDRYADYKKCKISRKADVIYPIIDFVLNFYFAFSQDFTFL